jgi:hypothetical protein
MVQIKHFPTGVLIHLVQKIPFVLFLCHELVHAMFYDLICRDFKV